MKKIGLFYGVTGALAGLLSGFLGTGGGLVVVPLLLGVGKLPPKRAFATSLFIMLPICAISAGAYLWRGQVQLGEALPYLLGGLLGGLLCGAIFSKCNALWLRRIFGALLLYGGVRSLFF